MATHSSVLAWRIPETGEPGRLQSRGSHRVGLKRLSSSNINLSLQRNNLLLVVVMVMVSVIVPPIFFSFFVGVLVSRSLN